MIEKEMWRMEADLWTVISTFVGSSVNPAFPTAAIVPFNFSHYLLCSQTNKLINLLIVQTFQLHSSWIYDCLVNGWWVLCRKHHPNGTTVNTRDRKQTDMFDTLFLDLTLNYSDWNKQIMRGKWLINIRMNNTAGCLYNFFLGTSGQSFYWCSSCAGDVCIITNKSTISKTHNLFLSLEWTLNCEKITTHTRLNVHSFKMLPLVALM